MKRYVLKDNDGNYLSRLTFQNIDKEGRKWLYIYFTGRTTGFTTYDNRNMAVQILQYLNSMKQKLNLLKTFQLAEIDRNTIGLGECIKVHI